MPPPAAMLDPSHDDRRAPQPARELGRVLRLSVALWLLGLPGVLAMAWQIARRIQGSTLPEGALPLLVGVQGSLLLAAAAFLGAWVAPRLGLEAPLLQALLARRGVWAALRRLWLPSIGAGVLGAAWMVSLAQFTPNDLMPGDPLQALPLWTKLLYGGLAEEVLARWGMMAMVLFGLWRLLQPRGAAPRPWLVWLAIALSAMGCALANLPPAMLLLGGLTSPLLVYVLLGQTLYGLLAGFVYWRHGLEAAMLAHALALALSHGLA